MPRSPEDRNALDRIALDLQPTFRVEGESSDSQDALGRLRHHGIPALSVAFAVDGEIAWRAAWGLADVEASRRVDPETFFLAASISKPVTAIRALQLVEDGRVDLDRNINDYLTRWQVPDNGFTTKEKVTLRRILNHTAGLTVWVFPGYMRGDEIPSVEDVLDGKGKTPPVRVYKEPGGDWQYSGGGYTVMQLMIEEVDDVPFASSLDANVLTPLGMVSSTFTNPLPVAFHPRAATGYRSNGDRVDGAWPIYPEMAAAGLWTTPSELIEYANDVLRVDRGTGDGRLDAATVALMLTPGDNDQGLGPVVTEKTFGHTGADEGFRAQLIAWRASGHALVVMVNSDTSAILAEFIHAVAREYDLPGFEQDVKRAVELDEADRSAWVGHYEMADLGTVVITATSDGLETTSDFGIQPDVWRPLARERYFSTSTGQEITFENAEGKARVTIGGIVGQRFE